VAATPLVGRINGNSAGCENPACYFLNGGSL